MKRPPENNRSRTAAIALSGVISALCFVVMYLASVTEVLDLSGMVLCSMIVIVAVIEIGGYYPWLIWLVAGTLCFIFIPKKDIALEFILFGGVYPMLKSYFEKLPTVFSWILKIVFFNAAFTGWFLLSSYIIGVDVGMTLGVVAYLAANFFFILSDVAFTLMVSFYITKIRPRLKIGRGGRRKK